MSHSTVLVIGPNVEEQLAPFDENLAVEPYPKPVDADTLQRMIEHYRKEGTPTQQRTAVLARYDAATGLVLGVELADVQRLYRAYDSCKLHLADQPEQRGEHSAYVYLSTYNPRSRWDWFQVGGRWTGFYKLKPGAHGLTGEPGLMKEKAKPGYADQCFKRDVDVEGMRAEAETAAATQYDAAQVIIAGRSFAPWSEFLSDVEAGRTHIDAARAAYHAQDVIKAFEASREWAFVELEPFLAERAAYLQRARDDALTTFAVLQDGEWHERGRMGWFGMARDEKDDDTWLTEYARMFDALPGDALLTIVDVHI